MRSERFEIKKPEIPVGLGREINKEFSDWLLLFEKVKNRVDFVNDEVLLPLKLTVEEETNLGLFAKAALSGTISEKLRKTMFGKFAEKVGLLKEKGNGEKTDEKRVEGWPLHHRSFVLGRVIFGDKQGHIYRDIDIKGGGASWGRRIREPGRWRELMYLERGGIWSNHRAREDYENSEKLLKAGVRTARTLAIIELDEIIVKGKKISLAEASKEGIINAYNVKQDKPVIQVRGFGTQARIDDIVGYGFGKKTKDLILADAKKLVGQEFGKDFSNSGDYLEWFAKTLGKNVGLMHKNGLEHRFLTGHNITLDCRIVDAHSLEDRLEKKRALMEDAAEDTRSISKLREYERMVVGGRMNDIKKAKLSLEKLIKGLRFKNEVDKYLNQFQESYDNVFSGVK